jgi:prevent-host-death family protein
MAGVFAFGIADFLEDSYRNDHHDHLQQDGPHAMTAQVSIAQAKAEFAGLVARAERGEEIVVTRNGRPVARLAPLREPKPIAFGDLAGLYISDDLSLPESIFDDFEKGAGS